MGANLSKAPLTAVLYGALLVFVARLVPFSQGFREVEAAFVMPTMGYVWMIAYGLWLSIALALLFSHAKSQGPRLVLPAAVAFLGLGCFMPAYDHALRGHPTGVMTVADTWTQIVMFAVATAFLLLLGVLLLKTPDPGSQSAAKYKLRIPQLLIKLVVCPLVFCLMFFAAWYFFAWRVEAVRLYYTNGAGAPDSGFIAEIINMLLTDAGSVMYALLQGLLLFLLSLPLLLQLPGKRTMYIILNTMLYLASAVYWLIPSAAIPDAVRGAQLLQYAVLMAAYGVFTGFMLHTALRAEPVPDSAPAKAVPGKTAPPSTRAPTAARRP